MIKVVIAVMMIFGVVSSDVFTLDCTFKTFSDKKGRHSETMHMVYRYDTFSKKAYVEGNNGIGDVTPLLYDRFITMIEVTDAGNVVTMSYNPDTKGAVMSRHMKLVKYMTNSQWYGTCSPSIKKSATVQPNPKDMYETNIAILKKYMNIYKIIYEAKENDRKAIEAVLHGQEAKAYMKKMSVEGMATMTRIISILVDNYPKGKK